MSDVTYNNQTPPQTLQEVFDRACERLITHIRWGRAIDGRNERQCVYRQEENGEVVNCCVVGYMIPDWPEVMPDGRLTAQSVGLLLKLPDAETWFGHLGETGVELLTALQSVHDAPKYWYNVTWMRNALLNTATRFQLKLDPKFFPPGWERRPN